jgi:C4-dicarboxylate transporter DctM subunit
MPWEIAALIIFGMVFLFLMFGISVAVSLGGVAILMTYLLTDVVGALGYAPWNIGTKFVLVAIPLFIFMGELLLRSGLSNRLYTGSTALLGRIPGNLLHANIVSCSIFAAISGSSVATAATIGTVAIPELEKRGYDNRIVMGSLAAGGTLGILIPPSIAMIIYGSMTGQSIGRLFIAGIIPGIILSLLYMSYIVVRVMTRPQTAPVYEKIQLRTRILQIIGMWPIFVVMLSVLGGIYFGVTTPTEAAAIGALMALIFSLSYKKLTWSIMRECLRTTVKTTSMIMLLVVAAQLLVGVLTTLRVPDNILAWVNSLALSPLLILLVIYGVYLFLGCFMDGTSLMLVTLPIVYPIIVALGYYLIWFGVALVLLIEMALLTPPVGLNVYVIHGLRPQIPLTEVFIGIIPFFFMTLVALAIVTAFPQLATWLPSTMMRVGG